MVGFNTDKRAGDGRYRLPLVVLACIACSLLAPRRAPLEAAPPSPAAAMRTAATAFLQALDRPKRAQAARPFDDRGRTRWSAFPGRRVGIAWRDLDATQRGAAEALLRLLKNRWGVREKGKGMREEGK